ncbi:hypothetical protein WK66_17280 [Burkholderia ubonensis]|uniref:hypothetical protein n=1 Tax=Burkholderia ubonensis TaxID=101571 RepID=UPI00075C969F|nr:hypothetical protein [Burkholderia ubonensis]KVU44437.1 hypothetical protein WK66_17280 [Burkholderia ubonensis]
MELEQEKRRCIAELMDAHPAVFRLPADPAKSWGELMLSDTRPCVSDMAIIDKAVNMLTALMREGREELASALADAGLGAVQGSIAENSAFLAQFETDVEAMEVFRRACCDDDAEAEAFGRAIAMYKTLQSSGGFSGTELVDLIFTAIDAVKDRSDITIDLKAAAKRITMLQFGDLLKASR